jgi:hypothetical protein
LCPTITLNGETGVQLHVGSGPFIDPGAVRDDNGTTGTIEGVGTIDYHTLGEYPLTYTYTGTGGSATITRIIHIIDDSIPNLELLGDTKVRIDIFSTWTDPGAIREDNGFTGWIQGSGYLDTGAVDAYTLLYTYTDSGMNTAS